MRGPRLAFNDSFLQSEYMSMRRRQGVRAGRRCGIESEVASTNCVIVSCVMERDRAGALPGWIFGKCGHHSHSVR